MFTATNEDEATTIMRSNLKHLSYSYVFEAHSIGMGRADVSF